MSEKLIKEYVESVLREGGFFYDLQRTFSNKEEERGKKNKSWWKTFLSKFDSNAPADELTEEWIEEQELYYDANFTEVVKKKIKEYTRAKLPRIASRARGDMQKANRLVKRALEKKFNPEVQELRKAARERESQEDADID